MTLSDALDEFLLRCEAVNLSPETIKWYGDMIGRVIRSDSLRGISEIDGVRAAHVRAFLADKRRSGVRSTTCNGYRRALGAFFGWLVNEDILDESPLRKVERLKEPSGTKRALTDAEIDRLLSVFDRRTFIGIRNHAITRLLLETGLRVTEACRLRLGDIRINEGIIIVEHGKGDRRRVVRFGSQLALDLRRYLRARAAQNGADTDDLLFFSTRGLGMLNKATVRHILARAARKVKLDCKVGPHMLRHTSATRLAENGASAFMLMAQLGHRRLATAQNYVHMAEGLDREAFGAVSPLDNRRDGRRRGRRNDRALDPANLTDEPQGRIRGPE